MPLPWRVPRALRTVALGALFLLPTAAQEDDAQDLVGAELSIVRDDQNVEVHQGERVLLRYRYSGASHKPYVDVLTTPGGRNVLRDAPADHLHHHGLMLAWRVDGTNFWEESEGSGRELHVEWDELRIATTRHVSEPGQMPREQAILRQHLEWVGPTGEPLLAESRELTIRATIGEDEPHVLFWHSTFWTPEGSPGVLIEGANYNGLGARFLAAMDRDGHYLNAHAARGVQGTAGEQAAWCAYSAPIDEARRATVAMFGARANPRHPTRWFTMDEPFSYLAATLGLDRQPLELGPDDQLSLSYGVAVFDGEVDGRRIDEAYARWQVPASEVDGSRAPGLIGRYFARTDEGAPCAVRVDPAIAFDWSDGTPDDRVPAGPFSVAWEGELLVPRDGRYRFSIAHEGEAQVRIDGQLACGPDGEPGERLALERGFHPLSVRYAASGQAPRVKLLWQGDSFAREVVDARRLSHRLAAEADVAAELAHERGRGLAGSYACAACHDVPGLEYDARRAPPLDRGGAWSAAWLERWVGDPQSVRPGTRMPSFAHELGEPDDVRALVAFLRSRVADPGVQRRRASGNGYRQLTATSFSSGSRNAGRELFLERGCSACHSPELPGEADAARAPSLADVGAKWSRNSLVQYLESPSAWHPTGRMPDFSLTEAEAADLVAYLSTFRTLPDGDELPAPPLQAELADASHDPALVKRGAELLRELRCAACHEVPGVEAPVAGVPLEPGSGRGCLDPRESSRGPRFDLSAGRRAALAEYLARRPARPSRVASGEWAARVVHEDLQCLACHTRDGGGGGPISRALLAELEERGGDATAAARLVPPDLSGVGAKLRADWLHRTLTGEAPSPRPWLAMRMPRFTLSDAERETLVRWLVATDGVPDMVEPPIPEGVPEDLRPAAHELLGSTGFTCASCHHVGRHTPSSDTVGPDLALVGQRISRAWFLRWLEDPARVRPGTPMPSFDAAAPGILDGDLDVQKEVLWSYLTTTSPSAIDLEAAPSREVEVTGTRARVVQGRVQGKQPLHAARGVAIGLAGGQSLLFDGGRLAWLGHWEGGFLVERGGHGARRHWAPAGRVLSTNHDQSPPLLFRDRASGEWSAPPSWRGRFGWLDEVALEGRAVRIVYRLRAPGATDPDPDAGPWVHVEERVEPNPAGSLARGYLRSVEIRGLPPGHDVVVQVPVPDAAAALGGAAALAQRPSVLVPGPASTLALRAQSDGEARWCDAPAAISYPVLMPFDDARHDPAERFVPGVEPGAGRAAILCPAQGEEGAARVVLQVSHHPVGAPLPEGPPRPAPEQTAADLVPPPPPLIEAAPSARELDARGVTVPVGFRVERLPLPEDFLVCALTFWRGALVVGGYDGDLRVAEDSDGDGRLDAYRHLAGPFDQVTALRAYGDELLAVTPGAVLRIHDRDRNRAAESVEVVSSAWDWAGHPFDWAFGLVRDECGDLLVGTSTPHERGDVAGLFGRGSVLRIAPDGRTRVVGEGLRYNFGWGRDAHERTYFTCNQGPWYVTCTICLQRDGAHYGYDRPDRGQVLEPVLFVPYPWCRSLTGLAFADAEVPFGSFQGQGLAADYNTRRIIRWTDQPAGAGRQGACYPFLDGLDAGPTQMVFGPDGALYIGFMSDGSWYPERARGGVYRVVPEGRPGLAVLRVESTPTGFVVEFTEPVDPASIGPGTCDRVHRYFHQYEGRYHSEEVAHEDVPVQDLALSPDGRTLTLTTGRHVTPRIVALQLRGVRAMTGEALESGEVYSTVHTQPDR
ncbi:MAG: c-type cytochrome [bacterium]|nr:c-type cytochrome [bacterium]